MRMFSKLFKGKSFDDMTVVSRSANYDFDIVGESHYQQNIRKLVGRRGKKGKSETMDARLVLEDENKYDRNAVRVELRSLFVDWVQVGYLSRADAMRYRAGSYPRHCNGLVCGGFQKEDGTWTRYGVKLDLKL